MTGTWRYESVIFFDFRPLILDWFLGAFPINRLDKIMKSGKGKKETIRKDVYIWGKDLCWGNFIDPYYNHYKFGRNKPGLWHINNVNINKRLWKQNNAQGQNKSDNRLIE